MEELLLFSADILGKGRELVAVNTLGLDVRSLARGTPPVLASHVPRLLKDICPGSTCDGDPKFLTPVGGTVYGNKVVFSAKTMEHGREIWVTDGSEANTKLLLDINPGSKSSDPLNFVRFGSYVYFTADNGSLGRELWRTDGTEVEMVADVCTGECSSEPRLPVVASSPSDRHGGQVSNPELYFVANHERDGSELWVTIADVSTGAIVDTRRAFQETEKDVEVDPAIDDAFRFGGVDTFEISGDRAMYPPRMASFKGSLYLPGRVPLKKHGEDARRPEWDLNRLEDFDFAVDQAFVVKDVDRLVSTVVVLSCWRLNNEGGALR